MILRERPKNLSTVIVNQILEMIRSGNATKGSKLPAEIELASRCNVGRTTIREALQVLMAMGVVSRSRQGTVVLVSPEELNSDISRINLTEQSLFSLYEARRILEVSLAGLAAERARPEDLAHMRQEIARLAAADPDNWEAVLETDMAFHTRIAEAARNEVLFQLFAQVRSQIKKRLPPVSEIPMIIQRSVAHHWQVYQAIADKDPDLARQIATSNLVSMEKMLIELIQEKEIHKG